MSLWRDASQEETEEIIEKIAQQAVKREMELPANFFLGTIRPFSYMGGQLFRVLIAAFTPFLGNQRYEYISVLEKNENIKRIIDRINYLADEREEEKRNKKEEEKPKDLNKERKWYHFLRKKK